MVPAPSKALDFNKGKMEKDLQKAFEETKRNTFYSTIKKYRVGAGSHKDVGVQKVHCSLH